MPGGEGSWPRWQDENISDKALSHHSLEIVCHLIKFLFQVTGEVQV